MNKPKLVAFVHYHLRGGGVTRVIEHAVEALKKRGIQSVVIAGEPPGENILDNVLIHEKLGYGACNPVSSSDLRKEIFELCRSQTGSIPEIWHFHNHNLGKNTTIPLLAGNLAENGYHVVFQMHDFPEDGRPQNYQYLSRNLDVEDQGSILYPLSGKVFYLVLNRRDLKFMVQAGIPSDRISVLPNSVRFSKKKSEESENQLRSYLKSHNELALYPTRAIRRKNIGEFLLLSAIDERNTLFAITLSPKNPDEQKYYKPWVAFAGKLNLPVSFDFVHNSGIPFIDLMNSAHHIVTTSITEGFGLAFLEPWLINKPLFGRNIPDITQDFVDQGIDLSTLYQRIDIPTDIIDKKMLKQNMLSGLQRSYDAYQYEFKPEYAETAYRAAVRDNLIDFGRLDEKNQEIAINNILHSRELKNFLSRYNPSFSTKITDIITNNKSIITEKYNEHVYADRLVDVYSKLSDIDPNKYDGYVSSTNVLMQFLKPERFNLLRS